MPASMETLNDWLAHAEHLHPDKTIELGLERAKEMAQRLGLRFDCPVITVAGTNGKGSTCAMLESIADCTPATAPAVYTSPHLVHFEERCRLPASRRRADALVPHFEVVEQARGDVR
jgi:dihydrofolate synthase/folylpolyglutamate synthase